MITIGARRSALSGVRTTLLLLALVAALAYVLRRSWWLATFVAAALLFILNQGYPSRSTLGKLKELPTVIKMK